MSNNEQQSLAQARGREMERIRRDMFLIAILSLLIGFVFGIFLCREIHKDHRRTERPGVQRATKS